MTQRNVMLAGVLLWLAATLAQAQTNPGTGVAGTVHDARMWDGSGGQVCNICHTPHNSGFYTTPGPASLPAQPVVPGPLWSHRTRLDTVYTLYASSTLKQVPGQPGTVSKLCLSCHDGVIAIAYYQGHIGSALVKLAAPAKSYLGTNLSNDHPIGITYDTALANSEGKLADPESKTVTIGSVKSKSGTIAKMMLVGGKVECNSCHDVHNIYTVGINKKLVKVDMAGSSLCLQCHNK